MEKKKNSIEQLKDLILHYANCIGSYISEEDTKSLAQELAFRKDYRQLSELDPESKEHEFKLFQIIYLELQKRDEMFNVPYNAEDPFWTTETEFKREIPVEIVRRISYENHIVSDWKMKHYRGVPGDVIKVAKEDLPFLVYNGFVKPLEFDEPVTLQDYQEIFAKYKSEA
jgi:hypothetical protein